MMRQAHALAGVGHGQLVAVIGEPGVGKSRLFYEFLCAPWTQGWLLLESQADSYGKAIPYHPVRELLKAYFQLEARDDAVRIREKVTGKLRTLDPVLVPMLPAVLALLDVPVDDRTWQALEPPQRRQWTLDALKRLLLRESQIQPVLLVCENLHWIDSETQAFLDSLIDSLPTARLLLLVNYRPEYHHPWGNKTYYTQLRIDPLPPSSAVGLLQALLGDDPTLEPLKRTLIERTEGNPFFLEESVQTLVESQVLVGELGAYRLAQALVPMQVPATVQAVLAARIDRLPAAEKTLLQTAAVIGKDVPFALLQAMAELSEATLRGALAHLQTAEFLYEASLFPELEYTFKHALTQEVAYGSLLHERRRTLHAEIVEAIERLAPDRLAAHVERLAHHALRGEVWEKALTYCRQAGTKAMVQSAYRGATEYFEQALDALAHLPETRDTREQAIDLRFDLRTALFALGEQSRIGAHLREAEILAEALGDQRRLGRVSSYMSAHFQAAGDQERAIVSGQRALAIAEALGDFALQLVANLYLGAAYLLLGDYRQAHAPLRWNIEALEGERLQERFGMAGLPAVMSRTWLLWCLAEQGEFAQGIVQGEEGVRIAETVGQPFSLIHIAHGVGRLYLRKGEVPRAIPVLERGVQHCQTGNVPLLFPTIGSHLGYAYALSGRLAEAIPLLEQAAEQAASQEFMREHALRVTWLGEAYLLAGRFAEATACAARALALSRGYKERGHEAEALLLHGALHSYQDPLEATQAAAYYHQALTLAEALGMRPLQAHCYRGLGTLYAATGQREQARTELSTAIEMYTSMDMTFWLPQTEAALAQVEGR
jgi:tetratricopeptide (TPR) repeat protein